MWTKAFWLDAIERILMTFVQGAAAAVVVEGELSWNAVKIGLAAGVLAIAKALVAGNIGDKGSASLTRLLPLVLLPALVLAGCASPEKQYAVAENTYTAGQELIRSPLVAPYLENDDTRRAVRTFNDKARESLDEAREALRVGDKIGLKFYLHRANSLLDAIESLLTPVPAKPEETSCLPPTHSPSWPLFALQAA